MLLLCLILRCVLPCLSFLTCAVANLLEGGGGSESQALQTPKVGGTPTYPTPPPPSSHHPRLESRSVPVLGFLSSGMFPSPRRRPVHCFRCRLISRGFAADPTFSVNQATDANTLFPPVIHWSVILRCHRVQNLVEI